jgi:ParB family chromosome partitioning protein
VFVVGERRWRAAILAGLETLACVVVTGGAMPEDLLEDQLIENCLREDLRPVEQARAFKSLLDSRGLTQRQLAERLQVGQGTISRALALLRLPEEIRQSVDAGAIKATAAYELSKLQDADDRRAVARKVVAEGLDHKATVAEVRRRNSAKTPRRGGRPRAPREQKFRGPRGVNVVVRAAAKHTTADVIADLRAIADRLGAAETPDAA